MEDRKETALELYLNDNQLNLKLAEVCSNKSQETENIVDDKLYKRDVYCKKKRVTVDKHKCYEQVCVEENIKDDLIENEIEFNTRSLLDTNQQLSNEAISLQNFSEDIMNSFYIFRGQLLRDLRHLKLYKSSALKEKGLNQLKGFVYDFFKYYKDYDEELDSIIKKLN